MSVSQQTIRNLLRVGTLGSFAACAGLVAVALVGPAVSEFSPHPLDTPKSVNESNEIMTRELEEFASLLDRPLRAPLYDPPPKPKQIETQNPKPDKKRPANRKNRKRRGLSELRLVGTMLEQNQSIAILVNSEGDILLGRVGDPVETPAGDGKIQKIELREVTITIDNDSLTLAVQP